MIGPTDLLHPSPTPHFKTFQAVMFLFIYLFVSTRLFYM